MAHPRVIVWTKTLYEHSPEDTQDEIDYGLDLEYAIAQHG